MAKDTVVMREPFVRRCKCEHVFQDKQYGPGNRLHNAIATLGKGRCTVCGTVN